MHAWAQTSSGGCAGKEVRETPGIKENCGRAETGRVKEERCILSAIGGGLRQRNGVIQKLKTM